MSDWRDHLTEAEAVRLQELDEQAKAASKERRRIYDRCRKRAARSFTGRAPDGHRTAAA